MLVVLLRSGSLKQIHERVGRENAILGAQIENAFRLTCGDRSDIDYRRPEGIVSRCCINRAVSC